MIKKVSYRVPDPGAQIRFYVEVLGMTLDSVDQSVGYGEPQARLSFLPVLSQYEHWQNDLYWKIAIAVPDVELACRQLRHAGVSVGEPRQFQDVGYLAHFNDPAGLNIELIDHAFAGKRRVTQIDPTRFGGGAHLNLLTLRVKNITEIESHILANQAGYFAATVDGISATVSSDVLEAKLGLTVTARLA